MQPERYQTIVVGVGSVGSMACLHLATAASGLPASGRGGAGRSVLGLERFDISHAMGSGHGQSRAIRLCYYEHPDYVPLLRRAYELWRRLERECGQRLLHMTGGVYIGPEDGEFVRGSLEAARAHDLPHEALDEADLARRFPMLRVPAGYAGLYEPNAGAIMSEQAIAAAVDLAITRGAEIRGREPVTQWEPSDEGIIVSTTRGRYVADRLVLCAGAWTQPLLGDLGIDLTVTRQTMAWFQPRSPASFSPGRFPVWGIADPSGGFHYGFPLLPGRPGVKIARHYPGEPVSPETIDRSVRLDEEEALTRAISDLVPDAAGPLLSMGVCMYTMSPDQHFIVDRHPADDRVIICGGLSGHGFKFASVLGEVLAELALRGETAHPVGFLGLGRLAQTGSEPQPLPRQKRGR